MMAERTAHQNVAFELPDKVSPDGDTTGHGYLAVPESGHGPGVIVIQEWWGLTDHIRDLCDRLAAEGFTALAPDLYGGWVAHDADEAAEMMQRLCAPEGARQLGGAVDFLLAQQAVTSSTVGAVGFCMGGGFVLSLAVQQGDRVSAAAPFYGVGQGVPESFQGLTASVQIHAAERDDMFPPQAAREQEERIRRESGAPVELFLYDADHAFLNDARADEPDGPYDAECARTAWDRAVAFLRSTVR